MIATEEPDPKSVTDQRSARRAGRFIGWGKCGSDRGLNSEHGKIVCTNHFPADEFGSISRCHSEIGCGVGNQSRQRLVVVPQTGIERIREIVMRRMTRNYLRDLNNLL